MTSPLKGSQDSYRNEAPYLFIIIIIIIIIIVINWRVHMRRKNEKKGDLKILKALLLYSILATCPVLLNLLDLITLSILGERYKL